MVIFRGYPKWTPFWTPFGQGIYVLYYVRIPVIPLNGLSVYILGIYIIMDNTYCYGPLREGSKIGPFLVTPRVGPYPRADLVAREDLPPDQ